jgi:putative ABC transport system permease protein
MTWCDDVQFLRKGTDFSTTVFGTAVAPNFFSMLGIRPVLGRLFTTEEAVEAEFSVPLRDTVILLSYTWWKSDFGGDPGVLGRVVELGEHRYTVIGVMPEYFRFPSSGQFWLPVKNLRSPPRSLLGPNIRVLARLKPATSVGQAQALLDVVAQRLLRDFPENDRHYGSYWRGSRAGLRLWALPLRESLQGMYSSGYDELRRTLLGFLVAVGFVLAIVSANVANLTLARTERRQHELAVRSALGAGRARLTRQLLTESLVLALAGGIAGLVVTAWGIRILAAFNTMPQLRPIAMDGRLLVIALSVSVAASLLFGLMPAWRAGRTGLNTMLAQGHWGSSTGLRGSRYRQGLVIFEIALALVLLSGAGLAIRSVVMLLRVDPGYDPSRLVQVSPNWINRGRYDAAVRLERISRVHERLAALPGVGAVGVFADDSAAQKIEVEGRSDPLLAHAAFSGWERSEFFSAAQIPLLSGRFFSAGDAVPGARAVIVNEAFAQLCWPGGAAVGRTFRSLDERGRPMLEVVGVVGNARLNRLNEPVRPLFYRPFTHAGIGGEREYFAVRTEQNPVALVAAIREALKAESQDMRVPSITLPAQSLYDRTQPQRTFRNYLIVFASVGVVLSALGIYGVLAYSVAQRTREIGIRMAVGADRAQVIRMVLGDGGRLVAIGVGVGLLAAFWLTTLLEKQLFATSPRDPLVLGIVAVVLSAITLLACWLPARRAAQVNPLVALRSE